jgi:hypothetical protein
MASKQELEPWWTGACSRVAERQAHCRLATGVYDGGSSFREPGCDRGHDAE